MRAAEAVLKDLSKMVSSMSLQTGASALHPTEPILRRTNNILRMSKSMLPKKKERSFFIEQPT